MSITAFYREWLRRFPKEPADRMATALAAVDAFEDCERKSQVSISDLEPLIQAACSPHKLVFETGGNLLARLAVQHPAAQQCFLEMMRDRRATARFHAVAYLDQAMPEPLREEMVDLGLRDRSVKVRQKAIERAEQFGFTHFLAPLEAMQRTETDEVVRRSLSFHIPLLRDGYLLEPSRDGAGYHLTVRNPESLCSQFIANNAYSEEFVRREVARLREAPSWG